MTCSSTPQTTPVPLRSRARRARVSSPSPGRECPTGASVPSAASCTFPVGRSRWTALLGSLFVASSFAQAPIPAPPQVGAVGFLLVDFASDRVIAEKAADALVDGLLTLKPPCRFCDLPALCGAAFMEGS